MSKGNQVIPVRFPKELLTQVENAVQSANATRAAEPYTVSSWIRKCIEEKISHLQRSRKKRPRPQVPQVPQSKDGE